MTTVTKNTPWRNLGRVPYAVWKKRITDAGGLSRVADKAVWEAAGDDSALMLEFLREESSYASDFDAIPASWNDPWNLQIAGVGIRFDSIVECVQAWRERMYSTTYKQGIYAKTKTIADLISVYAPKSDGNDTDGYIAGVVAGVNRNGFDPPVDTPSTPADPAEQEPPMAAYNYDNGVAPPWVDFVVAESKKYAGNINAALHFIAAVVFHSAYGGLVGTTGWYQGGNALTDTMVGNSYDGPAGGPLDGQIRRFNDAYGNRYAWSSGPVSNPIDDAAKFLEYFGPNKEVVNMYTTAMERSCGSNVATNPVTAKERAARVAWTAYHANRYGKYLFEKTGQHLFTCDTFPLIPSQNNRSFIIYHGEINSDKRTSCPDSFVRADLETEIAAIKALLSQWQKSGAPTTPPPVDPPDAYAPVKPIPGLVKYAGMDTDKIPALVTDGGKEYTFVWDRVKAIRAMPRRQTAEEDALAIGQDIEQGLEFAVSWLFQTDDGTDWYVTPYWTRVKVADTQRIADAA